MLFVVVLLLCCCVVVVLLCCCVVVVVVVIVVVVRVACVCEFSHLCLGLLSDVYIHLCIQIII